MTCPRTDAHAIGDCPDYALVCRCRDPIRAVDMGARHSVYGHLVARYRPPHYATPRISRAVADGPLQSGDSGGRHSATAQATRQPRRDGRIA